MTDGCSEELRMCEEADAPDETLAAQGTADNPEELDGEMPTGAPGTEEFNAEGAFP